MKGERIERGKFCGEGGETERKWKKNDIFILHLGPSAYKKP
jgi:hypothetical protein